MPSACCADPRMRDEGSHSCVRIGTINVFDVFFRCVFVPSKMIVSSLFCFLFEFFCSINILWVPSFLCFIQNFMVSSGFCWDCFFGFHKNKMFIQKCYLPPSETFFHDYRRIWVRSLISETRVCPRGPQHAGLVPCAPPDFNWKCWRFLKLCLQS